MVKRRQRIIKSTYWQKLIKRAKGFYKKNKYEIYYAVLGIAFAVTWYWNPTLVTSIEDSALSGMDNVNIFLKELYTRGDTLLQTALGLTLLWAVWKHRKVKNG